MMLSTHDQYIRWLELDDAEINRIQNDDDVLGLIKLMRVAAQIWMNCDHCLSKGVSCGPYGLYHLLSAQYFGRETW